MIAFRLNPSHDAQLTQLAQIADCTPEELASRIIESFLSKQDVTDFHQSLGTHSGDEILQKAIERGWQQAEAGQFVESNVASVMKRA